MALNRHPETRGAGVFLIGLPGLLMSLLLVLLVLCIIGKWVLAFRYREGRHPLWGFQYFRWWLVSS
jgi:hypothetical protein